MNTYIQHEKGLALQMNTYMEARPTSIMKKDWLCRTSYDEQIRVIETFYLDDGDNINSDDDDPMLKTCDYMY